MLRLCAAPFFVYCTGMEYPAKSTILPPSSTCSACTSVFLSSPAAEKQRAAAGIDRTPGAQPKTRVLVYPTTHLTYNAMHPVTYAGLHPVNYAATYPYTYTLPLQYMAPVKSEE